jgi:tRNA-specific 2-thiouridylase
MAAHSSLMSSKRVLVALSGGVDSSVAALLMQQQGFDVVAVFLRHGAKTRPTKVTLKQGCCSAEDALDAAKVADQLGIPFHSIDMEEDFKDIKSYFREEYSLGRTPNPCAVCNRDIKFGALVKFADSLDAEFLVTGHYARIRQGKAGFELWRGLDAKKDQSYVLFPISPEILSRTLLPVGELQKSETRQIAKEAGFPVFDKPDSQEICFVPSGNYRDVLLASGGLGIPGSVVDKSGNVLARHQGHMGFTRGQRRGLGFASTQAMYVLDIDPQTGDILVGPRTETLCLSVVVEDFQDFGQDGLELDSVEDLQAQYRSSPGGVGVKAKKTLSGAIQVEFLRPVQSVNPGQGLALYQGDRLLGGGWIQSVDRMVPSQV